MKATDTVKKGFAHLFIHFQIKSRIKYVSKRLQWWPRVQYFLTTIFVAALDKYPREARAPRERELWVKTSISGAARSFFPHSGDLIWWDLGKQQPSGGGLQTSSVQIPISQPEAHLLLVIRLLSDPLIGQTDSFCLRDTKFSLWLILSVCCVSKVLSKLVQVTQGWVC